MPQAVWTGYLSFGLVNMPVKLYRATEPKDVRFHQYEAGTGRRIRYRRVAAGPEPEPVEHAQRPERAVISDERRPSAPEPHRERKAPLEPVPEPAEGPEVPWEGIVKGFEVEPGRVVTVTPEELLALAPERSRVLEVEQFVDLGRVDPVHFDRSYYVAPQQGVGAERPYWLLYRAMEATGKVAVGRFVMRTKEYLAAIRPAEHLLVLETLFYVDEIRDPKEILFTSVEEPTERELKVARQLVEALAAEWDPSRHRDEFRERVLDLLRSKPGEAFVLPEPEEEPAAPTAFDLMEALKASVEAARQAREAAGGARGSEPDSPVGSGSGPYSSFGQGKPTGQPSVSAGGGPSDNPPPGPRPARPKPARPARSRGGAGPSP